MSKASGINLKVSLWPKMGQFEHQTDNKCSILKHNMGVENPLVNNTENKPHYPALVTARESTYSENW